MVNYKLGKIYRIKCNAKGLEYVGSTCEPTLAKRLTKHVGQYRCYLKGTYHYVSSFKILENDDYDIILIEKYPCNDKDELHSRECYFTNQIDCVNICKNQGLINRMGGEKEYKKEINKAYHKLNKDKILTKQKEYYELNIEKIKEKHECPCGGRYSHCSKARHFKTKKHIKYTEQQNEEV